MRIGIEKRKFLQQIDHNFDAFKWSMEINSFLQYVKIKIKKNS